MKKEYAWLKFLTEDYEPRFVEQLKQRNDPTKLPGFVEIYIESDLQVPLTRIES